MRVNKEKKLRSAERLFDAFGMIDDNIVFEAQEAYTTTSRKSTSPSLRKYVVSAMVAIVLVSSMIGGFVISNIANNTSKNDADGTLDIEATDKGMGEEINMILLSAAQVGAVESTPLEEIDFFDGEVSIIWSYEGDSDYYKLVFDGSDAEKTIKKQMATPKKEISTTSSYALACKVWISYGNGEVVSPYLKQSDGNVGYSTLFDYSPEVIPNDEFANLVNNTVICALDD